MNLPFDLFLAEPLTPQARDIMLDLILVWGRLDGAVSAWAGAVFGINPDRATVLFAYSAVPQKLQKMQGYAKLMGRIEEVATIKKFRSDYEKNAKPRNLIAHAYCRGMDPRNAGRLIFMPYEAVEAGGLAVDSIHLDSLRQSIEWGQAATNLALACCDEAGHFSQ